MSNETEPKAISQEDVILIRDAGRGWCAKIQPLLDKYQVGDAGSEHIVNTMRELEGAVLTSLARALIYEDTMTEMAALQSEKLLKQMGISID